MRSGLEQGSEDSDIIISLKADDELISASNAYCVQCGNCCHGYCANKEVGDDGLTYCLLHDTSGTPRPHGKRVARYSQDIVRKLNPEKWAKPDVCHTYGPHLSFLAILSYLESGEINLAKAAMNFCRGAVRMFNEYREFLAEEKK